MPAATINRVPEDRLSIFHIKRDTTEGFACQGYPVMTLLRGKVIVEDGRLIGSSSDGRWLPRRIAGGVLSRPAL